MILWNTSPISPALFFFLRLSREGVLDKPYIQYMTDV